MRPRARHLRRMRALYRERREALVETLRGELGAAARIHGGGAGMHLVLELSGGANDREVARRAEAAGLLTMPLSFCRSNAAGPPGLILGYGGVAAERLRLEARRLAALLAGL